jgi:tetratricopeptide (TPR) repeat protein
MRQQMARAVALHKGGRLAEAQAIYEDVLAGHPEDADVLHLLGLVLGQQGQPARALDLIGQALRLSPDKPAYLDNFAAALRAMGRLEEAAATYARSLAVRPQGANAHCHHGLVLHELGRLDAAVASLDRAIALQPTHADAHFIRGNVLRDMGRLDEAVRDYDRAAALRPPYGEAELNKGLALLCAGDFERGWDLYEWRLRVARDEVGPAPPDRPMLRSLDEARGQRVLLWSEQGLGDMIMFASIIPRLVQQGAQVLLWLLDDRLVPLFRRSFGASVRCFRPKSPPDPGLYDCHLPAGSLPRLFRAGLDDWRASPGYLQADPRRAGEIAGWLPRQDGLRNIGISWRSASAKTGSRRSLALVDMVKALRHEKVRLVNLQYGDTRGEIEEVAAALGERVHTVESVDNFHDLDGLSALITACDAVVTVANVTVHLAGGLGKPAHVLLPAESEWRWVQGSDTSYWYRSVRLYGRRGDADWTGALQRVARDVLAAGYTEPWVRPASPPTRP